MRETEGRKNQKKKQTEDNINLTATENHKALQKHYGSFVIPAILKPDIDSYVDLSKLHIKTLNEDQLKKMQATKVIMTLWVR